MTPAPVSASISKWDPILLENAARHAYAIWAHRAGSRTPWEWLDSVNRTAWKEAVEFLTDEPDCQHCGDVLLCVGCDGKQIYECPDCGEMMRCTNRKCRWEHGA